MEIKDEENIKKYNFKHLENTLYSVGHKIWGEQCFKELSGVLMEEVKNPLLKQKEEMQRFHNSGHVLFYLSWLTSDKFIKRLES